MTFATGFNRLMYAALVAFALYEVLWPQDYLAAAANMGISLIFDPFDGNVGFSARPLWQRTWLIIHLVLLFGLFIVHFV